MGSSLPTGNGAVVGSVPVPIVSMSSQLVIPRSGCTPALPASASPARFIFDQQTETVKLSRGVNKLKSCPFSESARSAGEKRDGTTVDPGALETCGVKQPSEAAYLERKRAQRIPSWPGADNAPAEAEYICADQPADLNFRLQKCGGPYIYSAAMPRSRGALWPILLQRSYAPFETTDVTNAR